MYPLQHLWIGAVFASMIFFIFPEITLLGFFIIVASGVLIDVDHYLIYVGITKDINLRNAYLWNLEAGRKLRGLSREERKELRHCFFIFHGIEPLVVVYLLSLYIHQYFFFIFVGMSFHMFLDIIELIRRRYGFRKISLIYDIIRFDKTKLVHK
jgi:hypothetical protein